MISKIKISHQLVYWIGICVAIYLYDLIAALFFVLLVLTIMAFCYLVGQSYIMAQRLLAKTDEVNKKGVLLAFTLVFSILMSLLFTGVFWGFTILLVALALLKALFFHFSHNKVNNQD